MIRLAAVSERACNGIYPAAVRAPAAATRAHASLAAVCLRAARDLAQGVHICCAHRCSVGTINAAAMFVACLVPKGLW